MELLFATSNKNKVSEANDVARKYSLLFEQIHVLYPEIRSDSVAEVAKAGAEYVYGQLKKPVIVEDSGLFINALGDFPGAYSRFVFDKIGNKGVLKLLDGVEEREARFVSSVAYAAGREVKIFEGAVEGKIINEELGTKGFGYDPIFKPKGYVKTFAEEPKIKNEVSHRRIAVDKLCQWIKTKSP